MPTIERGEPRLTDTDGSVVSGFLIALAPLFPESDPPESEPAPEDFAGLPPAPDLTPEAMTALIDNHDFLALLKREIPPGRLSRDEEYDCAYRIRRGHEAAGAAATTHSPNLQVARQIIVDDGLAARNMLVSHNIPLAIWWANQVKSSTSEPFDDLIMVGIQYLYRSADDYNPKFKCSYGTYASWRVRRGITKYINDCAHIVRVPEQVNVLVAKYVKESALFEEKHHRPPTPLEIAACLNVDQSAVQYLHHLSRTTLSFERPDPRHFPPSPATLGESTPDVPDVFRPTEDIALSHVIRQLLSTIVLALDDRRRETVELYFYEGLNLREVGEQRGVSYETVRTDLKKAFEAISAHPLFQLILQLSN